MSNSLLLLIVIVIALIGYVIGRSRSDKLRQQGEPLHSLPRYHGYSAAIGVLAPALLILALWSLLEPAFLTRSIENSLPDSMQTMEEGKLNLIINDIKNLATGGITQSADDEVRVKAAENYTSTRNTSRLLKSIAIIGAALLGLWYITKSIGPAYRARVFVERSIMTILIACSCIAILTTLGIVLSVIFESLRFFDKVPITDFVFGTKWSPQTAIREDQVGSSGAFGAVPLFAGTLLISAIAMLVAIPFGLMSAIYLAEYASSRVRAWAKPLLEILAGIPTVVYGFFAAITVAPLVKTFGQSVGIPTAADSALAAGLVMGIMIIPFVSSLSDDVITAVPQSLRDGSLGLGATKSETIKRVVIPAALPGIVGGILLAVSRAIGETMIVVMAAGLSANKITWNPMEAVTTVTVQIVTLLVGDQEFDSPKTLAAFALGLMLFVATLILNIIALHTVRKYREQYD